MRLVAIHRIETPGRIIAPGGSFAIADQAEAERLLRLGAAMVDQSPEPESELPKRSKPR